MHRRSQDVPELRSSGTPKVETDSSSNLFLEKSALIPRVLQLAHNLRSAATELYDQLNVLASLERAHFGSSASNNPSYTPLLEPAAVLASAASSFVDHAVVKPATYTPVAVSDTSSSAPLIKLPNDPTYRKYLSICAYGLISSSKKGLTHNQLIATFRGRESARGLFSTDHFLNPPEVEGLAQPHPGPVGWKMIHEFTTDTITAKIAEEFLKPTVDELIEQKLVELFENRYVAFQVQKDRIMSSAHHGFQSRPPPASPEPPVKEEKSDVVPEMHSILAHTSKAIDILLNKKPDLSVNSLIEFLRGNARKRKTIVDWGLKESDIVTLRNYLPKKDCEDIVSKFLKEKKKAMGYESEGDEGGNPEDPQGVVSMSSEDTEGLALLKMLADEELPKLKKARLE
ncbi:hypothetical protein RCL1_008660 [Eukaryota sp. TZLM3-RCL]